MNPQTSSYDKRRTYQNERYLRSEHLMSGGKYLSVTWTIKDVVFDCPAKRMGAQKGEESTSKMPGIEFVEAPGYVLGLCKTNESMLCMVTGEGHPSKWIGKKIQIVVRLIADRKTKTDIPALRIWTDKPIYLGRVRDQMGRKVDSEWYASNSFTGVPTDEPEKKPEPAANHDAEVAALLVALGKVTDETSLGVCRTEATRIWKLIDAASQHLITDKSNAAKARIAPKPATGEPTDAQTELANTQAKLINGTKVPQLLEGFRSNVADYLSGGELTAHQADALTGLIDEKLLAVRTG